MALYKQDIVDINLNTGSIYRSFLGHSIGYKNDDADRFGIRAFRDGVPVDLSGASCQAVFMAPNGVNIALTSYGTIDGNVAYVTLPQACYDYEGQFCLSIQLVGGGVTGTMRIVDGTVVNTGASGTVAPTSSVPTYQEILSTYAAMQECVADYEDVVEEQDEKIDSLKSAFVNYTLQKLPIFIIKDHYVNTTGEITAYNGWDCTDYVSVKGMAAIIVKTSVSSGYNVFFDANKNKVSDFIVGTSYKTIKIPNNAVYAVFSNTSAGMANFEASIVPSVMNEKHPSSETSLSALSDMGVYNIAKATLSSFNDKPTDVDDAVATLINYSGAYASGNFTIQRLYQLSGKAWERIINTATGDVAYAWKRIDPDSYPFELADNSKAIINGRVYLGELIADTYINVNAQGVIASYDGWSSTDYVEITDSLRDYMIVYSSIRTTFNAFYTSEKAYISAFTAEIGTTKVQIPSTAKYFRLSSTTAAMQTMFIYGVFQPYDNYFKGKKLVTAGDSYTAANWAWSEDYAQYDKKNFGYYIAQRNGMAFVNAGISGSTMAIPTNGEGHNPFVVDRYTAIPADTDYLTLWFGINDAANCTLGSITDGDDGTPVNNTFYGAWNTVLKYYLTNRPWMKVLIIVTVGATAEFRQAVRDVAEKWGYPYLDWVKDKSLPAFFDRDGMCDEAKALRRNAYGYNGPNEGHPNPQWYQYESTIIEAKLRSI